MGKPLAMALRERVCAFVEEGHGHREAARHFRVSPRFVNELMKRRRETGLLVPLRQGHAPGSGKLAPHVAFVQALMAASGELTLDELRAALEARGVLVHRSSVGRLLHRLGLRHKKHCRPASRNAPTFVRRAKCGSGGESASLPRPCRA